VSEAVDIRPTWHTAVQIYAEVYRTTGNQKHLNRLLAIGRGVDYLLNVETIKVEHLRKFGEIVNAEEK
jgi:cytochrome c1